MTTLDQGYTISSTCEVFAQVSQKFTSKMSKTKRVDKDKTAPMEQSDLGLLCLLF